MSAQSNDCKEGGREEERDRDTNPEAEDTKIQPQQEDAQEEDQLEKEGIISEKTTPQQGRW